MDRRYLLKALLAGLSLAGMSFPVFSATKANTAKKTAATGSKTKSGTTKPTKTTKTAAKAKARSKTAQTGKSSRSTRTAKASGSDKSRAAERAEPIKTGASLGAVRAVSLDIVNTGEKGREIVYFENGQYQADALFELNLLMRDWRADKVRAIDPKLFDTLYMLQKLTGTRRPFEVISAYRSPLTNFSLLLDGEGSGVARNSLHMDGKAVDIRLPGVHVSKLNKAAVHLAYGGVGYYPSQGFLHVDTGDVRRWRS